MDKTRAGRKSATPVRIAKAVFWSFLGIRKRADHESDMARLSPAQVIVAGIVCAALLVATLLVIIRLVIRSAAG